MNMVKPEGIKKKKKRWFSKGIYLKNVAIGIEKKLERGFDRWTLSHISRDEDEWLSSVTMTSDFLDKTRKYCDALRSALLKSTEILVGAFKAWTVKLLKNQSIYCSFWLKKKQKKSPIISLLLLPLTCMHSAEWTLTQKNRQNWENTTDPYEQTTTAKQTQAPSQ